MPRGRKPEGETPLSNAERQAGIGRAIMERSRLPWPVHASTAARRSRPQRWNDAVAELLTLQADYTAWLEALPEALQDTPDRRGLAGDRRSRSGDAGHIEPPRGYGRD